MYIKFNVAWSLWDIHDPNGKVIDWATTETKAKGYLNDIAASVVWC